MASQLLLESFNLHQITTNTYVYRVDARLGRVFVGILVTSKGTVLIDSGNGTAHANEIQQALQGIAAPPVTHILLTHHHWDHVFGNCVFPNAHIIAHEQTQYHLQIMAQEPWSEHYVKMKGEGQPWGPRLVAMMAEAVPDWTQFKAVPAHETFTNTYQLTLGEVEIEMVHVGGQHEPDSCIVFTRPGNILFLGDATYGRGDRSQWDNQALLTAHKTFLTYPADHFAEGHRLPVTRQRFQARVNQLHQRVQNQSVLAAP